MNILLTNDDGYTAEGIMALHRTLSERHQVFLIAPEHEQSACSNAITVRSRLRIRAAGEYRFSVSGFPADCVIIGLSGGLIPDVDMVVSGINHGPNVGDDLVFSGTVAAARTAYVFGKAAIAVSLNSYHRPSRYFHEASMFVADFIDECAAQNKEAPFFYNINYPDLPREKIHGTKYTHVGRRIYRDSFTKTGLEQEEAFVQMGGYIESVADEGSDVTELERGFISITPLMNDPTDYPSLARMAGKGRYGRHRSQRKGQGLSQ